jgi:hypothetical protein
MSVRRRLDRLRRLTRAEVAWRSRTAAQRTADRLVRRLRRPAWRRERLAAALGANEMRDVRALLAAGRFEQAHHALAAHVGQRPARSLLHPSMRVPLRERVLAAYPGAVDAARSRGDRILNDQYDLLGYEGLHFAGPGGVTDWHLDPVSRRRAARSFWADVPYLDSASGDHKVIWELNRHQHWLALGRAWWLTGDHRYRARVIQESTGWLKANPPLTGVNWASALELAFRAISWTWAIELFADGDAPGEPPWLVDLLLGLDAHLRHIERNLSRYFSPNTHLLGEALALYVCGRTWPELSDAAKWARIGGDILVAEMERQVLADGFHAEQSTHYHRYALDFYLLALSTARLTHDHPREPAFAEVADRMATALRYVTDSAGRIPLIGDDDGGQLFPIAGHPPDDVRPTLAWAATLLGRPEIALGPPPESATWLTAALGDAEMPPERPLSSPPNDSVVLGSSGYCVSRRDDSLLVFDAGAHGFMNGGHAHADALGLTLSIGADRLLIDPGTGTYTMDPGLRDRLRSSKLHNTVTVDGRSQSVPAGPFHWARTAGARLERAVVGATFDLFHAATDAYAPVRHERFVFATGARSWIVADRLTGPGRHEAAVHWHIDPAWSASSDGRGAWTLTHGSGVQARLAITGATVDVSRGDESDGLGWVAPIYGRIVPGTTLRGLIARTAPFWIVTTIDAGTPQLEAASTTRLDVLSMRVDGTACAVMTRRAGDVDVTLFRATRDRDPLTVAIGPRDTMALTTDAAALHARLSDAGQLLRVCLAEATVFRFDGTAPVTVTCPTPIADLDVRLDAAGTPLIWTSCRRDDVSVSVEGSGLSRTKGNGPLARQPVPAVRMPCVESPASPTR